jgi:SAM-dependent methyltransferase
VEHAGHHTTTSGNAAPDRSAADPVRFGPSPFKGLVVKSEYLLQSVLKYPFAEHCPHCRSPRHELVARKYTVARIVRCTDCGLFFSRPIYRSWLAKNLYDGLYTAGFGTTLPDEARLDRWLATGFRDTRREADTVLEKLRLHAPHPSASLLEIGCSWGYFLYQAAAAGFDVTGVEIGANRRAFGQQRLGLEIVGDLSELPVGKQYDLVYSSHVLEHFTDLHGVFPRIASALKDDGVLFIEVPNFDPQQFGSRCFTVVGAVHPLGFNSEFFRTNLPRHGLAVTGIFARWDAVPDRLVPVAPTDVFIVRAARARASDGPER